MSKSSARDSLALSLILGFATLVSFVSQLAIARTFGTGLSMDLYLQAIAIPLFVLATFGGLFNYAMVPVLTRARADAGHSRMVAGAFLRAFGILAFVVGIAGWMLAPFQLRVLGAGRLSPESLVLSTLITRLTWVTVGPLIVWFSVFEVLVAE